MTSALFFAYWLPELFSAVDAIDRAHAWQEALVDLRYLPFLWLVAAAVANARGCRTTFTGLAVIVGIWTADALLQALSGTSPYRGDRATGVDQQHGQVPLSNHVGKRKSRAIIHSPSLRAAGRQR